MDAETLIAVAADPRVFRQHLLVDTDDGPRILDEILDDWQRADFEATDSGWQTAARVEVTCPGPVRLRSYLERPRGHSKTADLAVMVAWALFAARCKVSGVAAAADRDQSKLLRDAIERLADLNPWLDAALEIQSWVVRNPRTKSELSIISSESSSSFGILCDFVCFDELTHWSSGGGESLFQSLVSAAAKRKHCMLAGISNAGLSQGGTSWHWRARESFRLNVNGYFSRLEGPQASWITSEQLEEQRQLLPAPAFDRLWLNLWTTGGSDLLSEGDLQASITLAGPSARETGFVYIGAVDLAVSRDSASFVVLAKRAQRIKLARCYEWKPPKGGRISLEAIQEQILLSHNEYRFHKLGTDPWGAAQMIEVLQKRSVPIVEQPQSPAKLVAQCGALLEVFRSRAIELYDFPELINDLRKVRVEERNYGCRLVSPRGPGGHGDNCTALSIGIEIAKGIPDYIGQTWGSRNLPSREFPQANSGPFYGEARNRIQW